MQKPIPGWFKALAALVACSVMAVTLACLVGTDVSRQLSQMRGLESGLSPDLPPLSEPRFATNVSLERYENHESLAEALERIRELGFGIIRQRFAWAELQPAREQFLWERWDRVLSTVSESGLQVIAVLDTSPAWARTAWEADNPWAPPTDPGDYARFAQAFAARYGGSIAAYQVWDEPNIEPHWGKGPIDPAAYVELLRQSSQAIRQADPSALIIAGGLAPNLETGGRNMGDLLFLREIYRRGAGAYFDILGVKAYGFWSGPDDRRVDAKVLNFSRAIMLREEMVRRGEQNKPIWALELGWCALPDDWTGRPSPQGSDAPFIQAERMQRAMERAQQEWPWMGLMCVLQFQPSAPPDDPVWGYALYGPAGDPTLVRSRLQESLTGKPILYPGLVWDLKPFLTSVGDSQRSDLSFWGTDLVLYVEKGLADGPLSISVDAQHTDVTIDLAGDKGRIEQVSIGSRVPEGRHAVRVRGTAAQLAALRG